MDNATMTKAVIEGQEEPTYHEAVESTLVQDIDELRDYARDQFLHPMKKGYTPDLYRATIHAIALLEGRLRDLRGIAF